MSRAVPSTVSSRARASLLAVAVGVACFWILDLGILRDHHDPALGELPRGDRGAGRTHHPLGRGGVFPQTVLGVHDVRRRGCGEGIG